MKYRKKPVVVEAMQFDGDNATEIILWAHSGLPAEANRIVTCAPYSLAIRTLEGIMIASKGDWIIKGVQNEFYPCKSDIFSTTYEPAND